MTESEVRNDLCGHLGDVSPFLLKNNFIGYRIFRLLSFFSQYFKIFDTLFLLAWFLRNRINSQLCSFTGKVFFSSGVLEHYFFIFDFLLFVYEMLGAIFVYTYSVYAAWCSLGFLGLWFARTLTWEKFSVIVASNISFVPLYPSGFSLCECYTFCSCSTILRYSVPFFPPVFYLFVLSFLKFLLT